MKRFVVFLAVVLGCVWAAPVEDGLEPASCTDAMVLGAANQAMDKINKDRAEGYVYAVYDLVNAHTQKHGENSIVFYLTMNVVETNCSVLSKTHFKNCEVRDMTNNPFYGQCKVVIFISRVHRVVRLYKYNCAVRPVAPVTVHEMCPDCPTLINKDSEKINKTVTLTLAKFNKESGLANQFALLKVNRATTGMGMGMIYGAEYTIQETTCANTADKTDNCPLMDCEFAHKGFCKGSVTQAPASLDNPEQFVSVDCQIYEPETAEREKKLHLLGGETDHAHNDSHTHHHAHDHGHGHAHTDDHDHAHDHKHEHGHDHLHDHTKRTHDDTHKHPEGDDHHHTHDHHGGSAHRHAHDHSHDHGINHDHVHEHHGKAHDHSGDFPNQHHKYEHAAGTHTHQHDHEMALDHDHKHGHLHDHEHHHHHHAHEHETETHDHPNGMWRELPRLGAPTTLPAFPDTPAAGPEKGVTLPLKPDPQIPDQTEPTILLFPAKKSAECPPPLLVDRMSIGKLFAEDPEFKPSA